MLLTIPRFLLCTAFFALAHGQTPPGTSPSTSNNLAVTYGTTPVTPNIQLPLLQTVSIPTITHPSPSPTQLYTLLLIDLSISTSTLNTTSLTPGIQLPLAPGISPSRTTRLHFWQTGLTFTSNGTLVNTTDPIAYYQPPFPPAGDIPHTYAFYLFETGAGFMPPPAGNPFSAGMVNQGMNRMSFSVGHLAQEEGVGALVGATYFRAQRDAVNGTATASASGTGGGVAATATTAPFTGSGRRSLLSSSGMILGALTLVLAGFRAA